MEKEEHLTHTIRNRGQTTLQGGDRKSWENWKPAVENKKCQLCSIHLYESVYLVYYSKHILSYRHLKLMWQKLTQVTPELMKQIKITANLLGPLCVWKNSLDISILKLCGHL